MAQFQSYSGGPHGMGAVTLPQQPNMLSDIGSIMGNAGAIPAQVQAAQLKNALTDLLMKSLTLPQTIETETPGDIPGFQPEQSAGPIPGAGPTTFPTSGGLRDSSYDTVKPGIMETYAGMNHGGNNPASYGDIFTKTPSKKVKGPNPEYTDTMARLKEVGPAFGFDFNKGGRSSSDLMALELARQSGRKELETVKGEEKRKTQEELYGGENKSTLQKKRLDATSANKDKDIKQRESHDAVIKEIANSKNQNDQVKTDKILKEREKYHNSQIENRKEWNSIFRKTAESQSEMREATTNDKLQDNLIKIKSQIFKLQQQEQSDPSVQTQLQGSVQQYNDIVDQLNTNPDAPRLDKWEIKEKESIQNWLRSLTGMGGSPTKEIIPAKPGQPSRPTKPSTARPNETPEQRRARILQELKK